MPPNRQGKPSSTETIRSPGLVMVLHRQAAVPTRLSRGMRSSRWSLRIISKEMFRFIGLNEGRQDIQFISGLRAGLGIHELFDAAQGAIIISSCLNRSNRHNALVFSDGCGIDGVILCMRTNETDIDNSIGIGDLHY